MIFLYFASFVIFLWFEFCQGDKSQKRNENNYLKIIWIKILKKTPKSKTLIKRKSNLDSPDTK